MRLILDFSKIGSGGYNKYIAEFVNVETSKDLVFIIKKDDHNIYQGRNVIFLPRVFDSRILDYLFKGIWLNVKLNKNDKLYIPYQIGPLFLSREFFLMFRNMEPFIAVQRNSIAQIRAIIYRKIIIRSMRRAGRVVFVSDYVKNYFENNIFKISSSIVIPHGISTGNRWNGIHSNYIVLPGSLMPYRNIDQVLKVYSELLHDGEIQSKLHICGNGPKKYVLELNSLIAQLGLKDHVLILQNLSQTEYLELLYNSKFAVVSSSVEACPNIALEIAGSHVPGLFLDYEPYREFVSECLFYERHELKRKLKQIDANPGNYTTRLVKSDNWETCIGRTLSYLSES